MPEPYDWRITYGTAPTRSIMWGDKEVAIINPRGDFDEATESDLAAGICFAARMHIALQALVKAVTVGDVPPGMLADCRLLLDRVATIDTGRHIETEDDAGS